jgi:hypothetical protein
VAFEDSFAAGLDQARTAVSSGAAARLLDQWIALAAELVLDNLKRCARDPVRRCSIALHQT